jgi:DinB family protein
MDTTGLRAAYESFLAVARVERFSPPRPPEWTAAQLLAHIVAGDTAITAAALAVAAGLRPSYDNRPSLDRWNLARICASAGDLAALIDLVEQRGQLLCRVAEQLTDAEADVAVPTLIISNEEVMLDSPLPLRDLIDGLGHVHLPRHAEQLAALAA